MSRPGRLHPRRALEQRAIRKAYAIAIRNLYNTDLRAPVPLPLTKHLVDFVCLYCNIQAMVIYINLKTVLQVSR
jgi:hypothetical protein